MRLLEALDKVKWFGLRKIYYELMFASERAKKWSIDTYFTLFSSELLNRRLSKYIATVFDGDEGHNIPLSKDFLGFGLIHYSFVRNLRPKRILCIGSRRGFVPALLAQACRDNGLGHVDFVDAAYDESNPDKHWSGVGFWKKIDPNHHFSRLGLSKYLATHVMTTHEFARKYPKKKYQYIYVDGDHSYQGVKLDYDLFWPMLESDGLMVFHDVVARGYLDKGKFGIWKFWQQTVKDRGVVIPFPADSGLGILQKKNV